MADFYKESDLVTGEPSQSGHVVYKKAKLKSDDKKVIYKLNKHNQPHLSLYEVALTYLINLFLLPNLTPKQTLVKNEKGKIVGLTSEHFCYVVALRETLEPNFCSITANEKEFQIDSQKREKAEDIPIYFLNEFPSGFFAQLYQASLKGKLVLDIDSLANVLCSSYTLEEDDLHKGNLGFYIVEQQGQRKVVFFKIDNDLLMADSVMSRQEARILHWGHGENAFKITARDLLEFPKLQDSKNHYWPTSKRYFVNPSDPKIYNNSAEIAAFIEIGKSPEFQQAKWRAWYKHILMQSAMIEDSLARALDKNEPYERAQLALISQATIARLSHLKAVLFSLPQFRQYVATVNNNELRDAVFEESGILNNISHQGVINNQMEHFKGLCLSQDGFKAGDTPLHAAIRLGDYRYHETWSYFREFANQLNDNDEKPLDVATKLAQKKLETDLQVRMKDVRQDPLFTMHHLLSEGVDKTSTYKAFRTVHKTLKIFSYRFHTQYLDQAKAAQTTEELITLLRDLGEDYRFSLKMKKEISVYCTRYFLKNKDPKGSLEQSLTQLKQALNGGYGKEPRPELQFIRQLRSSFWIVRMIRGLLGGTSTQVEINELIEKARKRIPPISSCFSCFFTKGHVDVGPAPQPGNAIQTALS